MGYNLYNAVDWLNSFLSITIFGNEIHKIIFAVVVFLVVFFGLKFTMKHIHRLIKRYIKNKKENIGVLCLNFIKNLPRWFFFTLEIYIPIKILNLPNGIDLVVNAIFLFVFILQLIKIVIKILTFSLSGLFKRKNMKEEKTAKKTIHMIVSITVWIIGLLIFLTNIGVDLTPVVASLGVASIGIAFALQNLLTDLFASFSIMMSKPFDVGDYIAVGEGTKDKVGTVTDITLKATHLLGINGQEIVIPNGNILKTEVINYGRMKHRTKRFKISVIYSTPTIKLKKIPNIIKKIIEKQKFVTYEWTYLYELNTYSIDYYISYDIEQPDYLLSLDIQETIIFDILEAFEKEKIHFAYPTQTVHTPNIINVNKR